MSEKALATQGETAVAPSNTRVMMHQAVASGASVDVLERLIALVEREDAKDARAAFNAAFAQVKMSLPSIPKNGIIPDNTGAVRSRFARRDDLHKALTPLLSQHGFAASFSFRDAGPSRMVCSLRLTHSGGHSEVYEAAGPWDMEIPKASVHQRSRGAQSFMKRNLILDAFDILDEEVDNDSAIPDLGPITPEQSRTIQTKLADYHISETALLKWIKSPTVEEISKSDYQRVIDELERKHRERAR